MRIGRKYSILLALALFLAIFAEFPAGAAQLQSRQSPQIAPAASGDLRAPVPPSDLQAFVTDLSTLVRALHDLNPNRPDVQSRMLQVEQELGALTPEQLTVLANSYDRPALSQAMERVRTLMPSLSMPPEQTTPAPQLDRVLPRPVGLRPDDAFTTTTLTPPAYSMCTPTNSSSFLGSTIPSDIPTDYGLFIALQVANGAQIPLNFLCTSIVVILGEGTNLPECIIAAIDQAIAFGLQVTLSTFEFCDADVLAAENDAAYYNTIAIFNNLGTDTLNIQNQLTDVDNDLNTHLTSVDADLNAHITAIDGDIDNHMASINTNVNGNLTAMDTDIDARIAAADLDIDTMVANADKDLNGHLTAVDNHLSAVDADVQAADGDVSTLQALELRMEIEKSLALGIYVGLFETPQAQGGYLELVASIVQTVISGLKAAGQDCGNAQDLLSQGKTDYAAGLFKKAYSHYMAAYQAATKWSSHD
jgi:hypothetical protein